MHSPDFFKKMQRTRKEILKEISDKYDSANKRRLTKNLSSLKTSSASSSTTSLKISPSDNTLSASATDNDNTLKPESRSNNSSCDSLSDHLFVPRLGIVSYLSRVYI